MFGVLVVRLMFWLLWLNDLLIRLFLKCMLGCLKCGVICLNSMVLVDVLGLYSMVCGFFMIVILL